MRFFRCRAVFTLACAPSSLIVPIISVVRVVDGVMALPASRGRYLSACSGVLRPRTSTSSTLPHSSWRPSATMAGCYTSWRRAPRGVARGQSNAPCFRQPCAASSCARVAPACPAVTSRSEACGCLLGALASSILMREFVRGRSAAASGLVAVGCSVKVRDQDRPRALLSEARSEASSCAKVGVW